MGFSRVQQGLHYRPMVKRAWERFCALQKANPKDKLAHDKWYREQLHACLGVWTTKQCNPRGDFDKLMAHFEEVAADGIKWQLKLHGGDSRRLAHTIRQICEEHEIPEEYACGLARHALRLSYVPQLERLQPVELLSIIKVLRAQAVRVAEAAHAQPAAMEDDCNPF